QFQFAGGFIFFEKVAQILGDVEQTNPLFVIERDGKAAETVDADAAFFSDAKFESAGALGAFFFFELGQPGFEFFVRWFGHGAPRRICRDTSIAGTGPAQPFDFAQGKKAASTCGPCMNLSCGDDRFDARRRTLKRTLPADSEVLLG